jgi:hypothetical protein
MDIRRDVVDGLSRRTSCIHRTYNSICGRDAASGSILRSAHQAKNAQVRLGVHPGQRPEPAEVRGDGDAKQRRVVDSIENGERRRV